MTIIIDFLFSVNAITSYPIQILCLFEIIEDFEFFKKGKHSKFKYNMKIYSERLFLIVIVTLCAIVIPKFVDFLNIMGSLGAGALAFILPPIYHIQCFGIKNLPMYSVAFDFFLIAFGFAGSIYSMYNSTLNMLEN